MHSFGFAIASAVMLMLTLHWPAHSVCAQGYSAQDAVRRMTVADGFHVDSVASEPLVRQPVAIDFDDRGRLWVLQYLQYPNPAGLKRVKVDRYSRTLYDRVPLPPPHGPKGADRLTILEDTDGDGRIDRSIDFISDLNLATGFAFGYGGVFVLQTPYLLFYPDRDRDDVPDGDPDVLLQGFGMEDSSSLANSLTWGPDGWLYGTQGTNLTATIRGVQFEQGLWRYHPVSKQFELFAEGGANMWGLDFDRQGNLLAGTNYGGYLMIHGVQGGFYQKSFAKHGELHNPFTFGYFGHAPHKNFQGGHVTVGGLIYQDDVFPPQFRNKYIAVDTLGHSVRWHHVRPHGSTVRTENGGVLLQANDTWFAPSDCVMGPDGAVYIADWYDQRTAHPDPDASWDRTNGRIYRLRWGAARQSHPVDPQSLSNDELIQWISSSSEWKVRRARRILAERGDRNGKRAVIGQLTKNLRRADDEWIVLQMLWTLHVLGGLDGELQLELLQHQTAAVRGWAIRLLVDEMTVSDSREGEHRTAPASPRLNRLAEIAGSDTSPVVIRQLASAARRMPAAECILLARQIAGRSEFLDDPCIPLLTWWAIEYHAISSVEEVLAAFTDSEAWRLPLIRDFILGRLMRRFAGGGSSAGFAACARLLDAAPDDVQRRRMIIELDAGLKMLGRKKRPRLPLPDSTIAIGSIEDRSGTGRLKDIPPELAGVLTQLWDDGTHDPLVIRVSARLGSQRARQRAVNLVLAPDSSVKCRLAMLQILQEVGDEKLCLEPAQKLVAESQPAAVRLAALKLLERFSDERTADLLLRDFSKMDRSLQRRTVDVLLGRPLSALAFLRKVDRGGIAPDVVTTNQLRRVALHENTTIDTLVRKHWGNIRAGTPEEKLAEIRRLNNDLRAGSGHVSAGRLVFGKVCAGCHRLFGQGKDVGPDLTKANRQDLNFLLVSIVDPSVQIRKEYLSYVIVTVDGRIVSGLPVEETAAGVTLLDAKNERTVIARDDIEEIRISATSLMPEKILKDLQPQQVRDLFRYLRSDRKSAEAPNR